MEKLTEAQEELYNWLVEYINSTKHAPSIRQMMEAMKLRSPAPIQSRLEKLRSKGYIDWCEGRARTIRILKDHPKGLPMLEEIAAGELVDPFTDVCETFDISSIFYRPNLFALKILGDSMTGDLIHDGDIAVLRWVSPEENIKNGEIVAARVKGHGTTLKHFYCRDDKVILKPSNSRYKPIKLLLTELDIQGVLVALWRSYEKR